MIKIFKRPNCAYCPMVIKYFDHIGVQYQVLEAEGSEYEDLSKQFGFSVPLVYNAETRAGMVGYNIAQLRSIAGLDHAS